MNLIEINNLVKDYSGHRALNDVSFSVPESKIFGLLGPNGAGKTTLIRIINQIIGPDGGTVLFAGKSMTEEHIANIGYLPEERGLYKKMKVGEQALYLAQLKGLSKKEAKLRLEHWFDKFDIMSWWNRKVDELSKGMQQKVQFITTVLHEPKLLIFDEPFSGFDPVNAELIKNEIISLRDNGSTIIFSTHNMASVEEICDEIALINHGENILSGTVRNIRNQYRNNIFNIEFTGYYDSLSATLTSNFEILRQEKCAEDITALQVRLLAEDMTTNDLLSQLMQWGTIAHFEEELPNMHEIFIAAVDKKHDTDE